jgi:CBS domain containing-hemolysin-like protein
LAVKHAHKRLPVYEERIDRITGTLNALDLLQEEPNKPIEPFIRQPHFVPGSIGIEKLLSDFRGGAGIMAVVVDEFGGAEGIVMLEDILEVIVGELEDEFDAPETGAAWIRKLGERHYLVSARLSLDRFNDETGLELPTGTYETLAGFLLDVGQSIPRTGTVIHHDGISFTVEHATPEAIHEVRVRW